MFGDNPALAFDKGSGPTLKVHSIFDTIQGEGPYAGRPATFVRLWGCHLQCYFCDTDFMSGHKIMEVEELVQACSHDLIVLTGGEPLRQNILPLCCALLRVHSTVQVETAGNLPFIGYIDNRLARLDFVVSPKTHRVHPSVDDYAVAYKYIITAREGYSCKDDGLPYGSTQKKSPTTMKLARPPKNMPSENIYVQPMDEQDPVQNLLNQKLCVNLCKAFGYTLSLQQHKILGLP